MASTLPSASIGSRTGKPIFSILTLDSSMPFSFTKAFHCANAPSAAGAPSTRPSRSLGLAMPVLDHQHRLDLLLRVLVLELDQRVDVEEAERIGAGGDPRDAGDRAGAGVDRHVEAFGLVVALVDGDEVGGGGTLELPVEGELDVGLRACRARRHGGREHPE